MSETRTEAAVPEVDEAAWRRAGIELTYTDTIACFFSWIAERVTERADWEGREVNVVFLFDPDASSGAVEMASDPGYFERAHDAACRRRGWGAP
jgi:hypothetical protein